MVAELIQQCIKENARIILGQKKYQKRYDGLAKRLDSVQERLDKLSQIITEKQAYREKIKMFLAGLQKQEELVTEFDEDLWYSLIEVTVFDKGDVRFIFRMGRKSKHKITCRCWIVADVHLLGKIWLYLLVSCSILYNR